MYRLIIAEKPSVARALADSIPGKHRRARHHIECSTGDVIAWCVGHVLELAPPEHYSEALKSWQLDTLPILPERWLHRVTAPELVEGLRALLRNAARIVHAGDPDREGQLLVDELLLHLGWRGPTDRLLLTDLSPSAIRRALETLESNEKHRSLYEAALGRQRADWLFGMNLTRLYTLRAQAAGYRGVLSVGRVQTPVLGLIVRRDREIEAFVSKLHFGVEATLAKGAGVAFRAEWAVGKEHSDLLDSEGHLLEREIAARVAAGVLGQRGQVTSHEETPRAEEPPLPYSLAELQIHAGKKLDLSAARVLEIAQKLYERQLITYPRSDCSHLPEAHWGQARGVVAAVRARAPELLPLAEAADLGRRGRAWSDGQVTAHHAIIPTAHSASGELGDVDEAVYELIARRYLQQFLTPFEYLQTRAEVSLAGEQFVAKGRRVLVQGWKAFEEPERSRENPEDGDAAESERPLPPLTVGESVACPSTRVLEKRTRPPKPFTDASLIQAMCQVARFVTDPQARKILQATDGIGTPATRAAIVETLFERGYVERRKKQIRSTPIGRALIDALPGATTTPDRTAVWEAALRRIQDRQLPLERFLSVVAAELAELVGRGKAAGALALPQVTTAGASSGTAGSSSPKPSRRPRKALARSRGARP